MRIGEDTNLHLADTLTMLQRTLRFAPAALVFALAACTDPTPAKPPVVNHTPPTTLPVDPTPTTPATPVVPGEARLRRLASWQYTNAIRDLLGSEAATVVTPPADVALNGSDAIGNATLSLSTNDASAYETSAFAAVQRGMQTSHTWQACQPVAYNDRNCMAVTAQSFGRRAFRRPLTDLEVARWTNLGLTAAEAYGDFYQGVQFALAGMLQSPNFLYLVEVGEAVPGDDRLHLTSYEMAARLSFFLLGTTPSDDLLDAADRGALRDPVVVAYSARTMLNDPRAKDALRQFFAERYHLGELAGLSRDDASLTPAVRDAMREETLRNIDDVVWDRVADARELVSTPTTFVNDNLAAFYGLPLPGHGSTFVKVTLPEERVGLLTQGAVLARFAHEHRSSPTLRGKFVREALLCEGIPAPPPNVNTNLPEPSPNAPPVTTRQRIEGHMANEDCRGCHSAMDPIGFGLEAFDAVGKHRTTENGLPIHDDSTLDGTPFVGARGLAALLHDSPQLPGCFTRGLFRQALGHVEEEGEAPALVQIDAAFEASGFRLQDAMLAIATSDAFTLVSKPAGAP
jgi:hypothetical protein